MVLSGSVALSKPSNFKFALLTSMSSRDLPRFTYLVRYDWRVFQNCFQQKLVFYETSFPSRFTSGWYVVTKANSFSAVLCFYLLRANCLESKVTSDRELSIYFFRYPRRKLASPGNNFKKSSDHTASYKIAENR